MQKNKLVLDVMLEIKKEEDAKALEIKKGKIRQMLSRIKTQQECIEKTEKELNDRKNVVIKLKEQLEKEDFSCLDNNYDTFSCFYGNFVMASTITSV